MFRCSLFQQNRFVGTIPDSIALLRAVTEIDFENNTLTGAVPAAVWAIPSLARLYAEHPAPPQRNSARSHGAWACTHASSHARTNLSSRRSLKGNRLTFLNVPEKNGTCCATIVHVGPTRGPGQPLYEAANGLWYYFPNKSIPIGNITACAADAANPGQRTSTDPNGEERYTFTLSAERACDGNVNLTTKAMQEWPNSPMHTALPARALEAPLLAAELNVYMYAYNFVLNSYIYLSMYSHKRTHKPTRMHACACMHTHTHTHTHECV